MSSLHDLILATLRQHVLMHIIENPDFSPAQQQQLAERVAACQDRHTLGKWIGQASQEAHSRRVCRAVAQQTTRELAAVARYVQDEKGRVLPLLARQRPQQGQVLRFVLNQN